MMANLETLQELLVHELQDLYNAENQIMKALPKMAKRATSMELREAFEEHLAQTETPQSAGGTAMGCRASSKKARS
jgi:ferritin-like metal-binding protein YciE